MSSVEIITKAIMKEVSDWSLENIKTKKDLQEFIDEIHIKFGDYEDHKSLQDQLEQVRTHLHKKEASWSKTEAQLYFEIREKDKEIKLLKELLVNSIKAQHQIEKEHLNTPLVVNTKE